MKVIQWISTDEADGRSASVEGMGGWFNWEQKGTRWADFLAKWKPEAYPYLEAIRESVLEHGLRLTGALHQYSENGVPLFEDGTVACFTFRGWGDLMAAIWSEAENWDYCYMDFYM